MVFSGIPFLYYFLPAVMLVYWLVPRGWKNTVCLAASLFFYAWGELSYLPLMLGSIAANYLFGRLVSRGEHKKAWLVVSIVFNLALLGVFKYADFAVRSLGLLLRADLPVPNIALPLGISFFTFQAMSYVVDVYRGDAPAQKNILKVALYISAFPQLVAGPIVRYTTVMEQIERREITVKKVGQGLLRFSVGLAKKVLVANSLAVMADAAFDGTLTPALTAWLGLFAYTLQIYFDFSGYSDMAIGLGRMLGFDFLENFDYPYVSKSITEFWRRWHISLGSFFRDYVYIPLGGSRRGLPIQIRNILIVWALTGLWHGAGWTFLLWGVYYGALLTVEKCVGRERLERIPSAIRHVLTMLLVMVGWVFFRADGFSGVTSYFVAMLGANGFANSMAIVYLHDYLPTLIVAAIGATPLVRTVARRIGGCRRLGEETNLGWLLRGAVCWLSLAVCTIMLVNSTYNPFIYFRF